MLKLLRTPRWIGWLAFLVLYVVVCCALGMWQWDRRDQAQTAIARLDANWSAPSTPVSQALPDPAAFDDDQQWQRVELQGRYLVDDALLVRGRIAEGSVGFLQLVPFLTNDNRIFFVDRGWVAVSPESNEVPASYPSLPDGELTVLARLRADEGELRTQDAPTGQVYSADLQRLAAQFDQSVFTGAYGLLENENGVVPSDVLVQQRPILDEGPHLSYALQWVVFALIGVGGFIYALRQESLHEAGEPRPKRKKRADEEEEDALLDAM